MSPELLRLPELLARVRNAASHWGGKSELARILGVKPQTVSQYLNGRSQPSAEVALRMLDWVTAREAKTKKDTRGARTPRVRKAQAKETSQNEPNSGQAET